MQLDLEEVLRVRVVRDPAQRKHLEVPPVNVPQENAQLFLLDLDIDAQVLLPQCRYRRQSVTRRRALTGGQQSPVFQYARAARLIEKGLRPLGVVRNTC